MNILQNLKRHLIKKNFKFFRKKKYISINPIRNKVLLVPILVDTETDNIYLFNNNIFYEKWNEKKKIINY